MKRILTVLMIVGVSLMNTACFKTESVDAGEEGVLIYQPVIFGHGGVDTNAVSTGRIWTVWTTDMVRYNIKPVKITEKFVDLTANDNVAIDFNTYLTLRVRAGKSPTVHEFSGQRWYENKLQDYFRTVVRNEGRTRSSIELRTQPAIIDASQDAIKANIESYIEEIGLEVDVVKVVIGKVVPPQGVLDEAERTASEKQRVETQAARAQAELSRAQAETNKALADKAFAVEFNMTTDQFLRNKELDITREAIEGHNDITIIMNSAGATPVFNTK